MENRLWLVFLFLPITFGSIVIELIGHILSFIHCDKNQISSSVEKHAVSKLKANTTH